MKHKYYDILQTKKGTYALFYVGLLAVLLQMLPYILLGEGTVIPYHDQMDGEMLAYIFQAKYLFGGEWISEFMGGAYKTALTPPAPAFVLLFCVMKPFLAYVMMHFIEIVIAYVGMYLLAREVKASSFFLFYLQESLPIFRFCRYMVCRNLVFHCYCGFIYG